VALWQTLQRDEGPFLDAMIEIPSDRTAADLSEVLVLRNRLPWRAGCH